MFVNTPIILTDKNMVSPGIGGGVSKLLCRAAQLLLGAKDLKVKPERIILNIVEVLVSMQMQGIVAAPIHLPSTGDTTMVHTSGRIML